MPGHRISAPITFTVTGSSSLCGEVPVDDARQPLLTRDLAAHAAGVSGSTIARWASRGWNDPATGKRHVLEVADRDWRKRPLYRYADVMAAEKATRRRGRRRDSQAWTFLDHNSAGSPVAG